MTPAQSALLLEQAWHRIVEYRRATYEDTGVFRSHLVDLDLWGVLVELDEDGKLSRTPIAVMTDILGDQVQPVLPMPMSDPAQEIYDAIITLLVERHEIREGVEI